MKMVQSLVALVTVLAGGLWTASPVAAQPLGSFRWQLQPYCNIVTFAVVQQGGQYQLDGTDDQCGAAVKASAVGLAFQNPNGTIGFGFTIVTAPGGTAVNVDATISIVTLSGTWRDSAGNAGTFIFTPGAGVPGGPRPLPSGGLAPNSVTTVQIAPAAVTNAQIAANAVTATNIVDGTITTADLATPPLGDGTIANFVSIALTATAAVIRSVTLTIPANGTVIANANVMFGLDGPATIDAGFCSITTLTLTDVNAYMFAEERTGDAMRYVSAGGTRFFTVVPGSFTVNLVCRASSGTATLFSPNLNAIYLPG